jgi:hypothetical protein
MLHRIRLLPTIDPPRAEETLHAYGCRVLAFVLAERVTATLSDRDLELADHVYPVAIAHPEILPIAVDKLSAARHLILATIALRRKLDAAERTGPATPATQPASHDRGRLAPLQPTPYRRPPSGIAIDVGF